MASCDGGWYGVSCDSQPSCRYWDTNASDWSTAGCRMATLAFDDANASNVGRVVCACDHLTEFAVVANVLERRAAIHLSPPPEPGAHLLSVASVP